MVKILTIDDSAVERETIIGILNKAGYKYIIQAETGEEGIEKYEKEKPDLVLLDLRLPGIDGVETLKRIKKINSAAKVIVVSVIGRDDIIEECKKLGAKAYVMKPILEKKLLVPVNKVLKKK